MTEVEWRLFVKKQNELAVWRRLFVKKKKMVELAVHPSSALSVAVHPLSALSASSVAVWRSEN